MSALSLVYSAFSSSSKVVLIYESPMGPWAHVGIVFPNVFYVFLNVF